MRHAVSALLVLAALAAVGCGNPLFSPCDGQADCVEGLRCVDLGNDQRLCTKPCTTTKESAGYPDGFDNDELYVDGSSAQSNVVSPQCADAAVDVLSQDNADQGAQNIQVTSAGVIGVCQVAPALLADDRISGDSVLLGFCSPG